MESSEIKGRLTFLLVDDHPFVREGIRSFLSDQPGFEVVGEASTGEEGLRMAAELKPDVILLDINMPGETGLETVTFLRKAVPDSKILVLTVHNSREYVLHVARSGADGYLLKEAPPEELIRAIKSIQSGKPHYSEAVSGYVFDDYGNKGDARGLSTREIEVLIQSARGLSVKEISDILKISVGTVQGYRTRLMEKLGVHNIAGLVKYAVQKGYVS